MNDDLKSGVDAAKALARNKQSLFKRIDLPDLEKGFTKAEAASGQTLFR